MKTGTPAISINEVAASMDMRKSGDFKILIDQLAIQK
jgi:hypothetical protein